LIADAPGRVWHVGTISKTVSPGLRLGWLIPPAAMHAVVLDLKHAADLQASSVSQTAFARLLECTSYDGVVANARSEYAYRAAHCAEAIARHVPLVRFAEPEGGMSLWLETDDRGDDIELLATALAYGVVFDPGSVFRPAPSTRLAMRISFSNTPAWQLEEGARRLGRALEHWRRDHGRLARSA
jgi:2-aminoadipate transaminase